MTQEQFKETVQAIMNAPSCCGELKDACQAWLDAEGTDKEASAKDFLLKEAKLDITSIDSLIAFSGSPAGVETFGQELAKHLHDHALEIKGQGAQYCDCPACVGCLKLINA